MHITSRCTVCVYICIWRIYLNRDIIERHAWTLEKRSETKNIAARYILFVTASKDGNIVVYRCYRPPGFLTLPSTPW